MDHYFNVIIHDEEIEELLNSKKAYFIYIYESRCPYCIKNLNELIQWIVTSKASNLFLIDKTKKSDLIAKLDTTLDIWLKKDLLIMLEWDKVLATRSGNNINKETCANASEDYVLNGWQGLKKEKKRRNIFG